MDNVSIFTEEKAQKKKQNKINRQKKTGNGWASQKVKDGSQRAYPRKKTTNHVQLPEVEETPLRGAKRKRAQVSNPPAKRNQRPAKKPPISREFVESSSESEEASTEPEPVPSTSTGITASSKIRQILIRRANNGE